MPASSRSDNSLRRDHDLLTRVFPGPALQGSLRPPGSKSIAQRVLVCAALTGARIELRGLPDGDDVRQALAFVRALGLRTVATETGLVIEPSEEPRPAALVDVGESGTLARLAIAALALTGTPGRRVAVHAAGSLLRRRSDALLDALRRAGVDLSVGDQGAGWPVTVTSIACPAELRLLSPRSSQEVSALLIALATRDGEGRLDVQGDLPSRPYVELTRRVLQRWGATTHWMEEPDQTGHRFRVRGPLRAPPIWEIEPDASLAAVALAAGVVSGGQVCVEGLDRESIQGDVRIADYLRAFGANVEFTSTGLVASGRASRATRLDLGGEPDLAPVLASVAAALASSAPAGAEPGRATTRLSGLGTLPGKESSRIEVLRAGFEALDLVVDAGDDFLEIAPPREPWPELEAREPRTLETAADHRMAFAFALCGLIHPVAIAQPEGVAKSWPGFWDALEELGARVLRAPPER